MKILSDNKKAYFEYDITDKFEAGIILLGQEVKSIKSGNISLKGSYVVPKNGEIYLIGCHISTYQPKNINYNSKIKGLIKKTKEKEITFIPQYRRKENM